MRIVPHLIPTLLPRLLRCLLPAGLCLLPPPALCQPLQVQLLAQAFPPLQYATDDGVPRGRVLQLVEDALQQVGKKLPLQVRPLQLMPLKRALQQAEHEANTLVLSVARTPDREARFLWLGEVAPYTLWLYQARDARLPPLSADTLAGKGLRIGVQDGSNFHEWLRQHGIGSPPDNSQLDLVPQNELNFRKLLLGRIDLLAQPEVSFQYRVIEQGLNPAQFRALFPLAELSQPLWLLAGRRSDPALVAALQRVLARLQAGTPR